MKLELAAGESWSSPSVPVGDFAAMTVHLDFVGSVLLKIWDYRTSKDGWTLAPREYILRRSSRGEDAVGLRLYKTAPRIEIVAQETSSVNIRADFYDI